MRKSTISESLFNKFTSNYQTFSKLDDTQKPFVYVDHDGNIRLLTNIVESEMNEEGIFAVSMAQDGWMEFLTLTGIY